MRPNSGLWTSSGYMEVRVFPTPRNDSFNGTIGLNVFPWRGSPDIKWSSMVDTLFVIPFTDEVPNVTDFLESLPGGNSYGRCPNSMLIDEYLTYAFPQGTLLVPPQEGMVPTGQSYQTLRIKSKAITPARTMKEDFLSYISLGLLAVEKPAPKYELTATIKNVTCSIRSDSRGCSTTGLPVVPVKEQERWVQVVDIT